MNYPLLANQMPDSIKKVWKKSAIVTLICFLIAEGIGLVAYFYFDWKATIILFILALLFLFTLVLFIASILLIPYRYAFHRYEITEEDLALQKGYFFRSTTYVPLNRIQHIETNQGPFLRKENLMELTIHTAATSHQLSGLDANEAKRIRQQLITLVKAAKEDV